MLFFDTKTFANFYLLAPMITCQSITPGRVDLGEPADG